MPPHGHVELQPQQLLEAEATAGGGGISQRAREVDGAQRGSAGRAGRGAILSSAGRSSGTSEKSSTAAAISRRSHAVESPSVARWIGSTRPGAGASPRSWSFSTNGDLICLIPKSISTLPGEGDRVADGEPLLDPGLVEPHADKSAGAVDDGHLGDAQSRSGLLHLDLVYAAGDGDLGAGAHVAERGHLGEIEVAERSVVEQVADCLDTEPAERASRAPHRRSAPTVRASQAQPDGRGDRPGCRAFARPGS